MGIASDFEFKQRFWIIGALFWLGFTGYWVGDQNTGAAIVDWFAKIRGAAAPDGWYRTIFAVASLFCFANAAIRTWATSYLNSAVMTDQRLHTDRLVADGPYRYVRNPLYFGNILLAVGFGFMASRIGFFLLVAGMVIFCSRLIGREEACIRAGQGEAYRAYCAAVPRLLPAMRARVPASGARPNWIDAFLGEAFMWVMALSVAAFAITLKQLVFFAVLASSFVVYGICYTVIAKRRREGEAGVPSATAGRPPKELG